jgi:uncharacterized membrane protein YgaE (UPF0421/DUF939 family)
MPDPTGRLAGTLDALRGQLEGTLLQAAKTAIAAGFAWFVTADLLGNQIPVFAPLAAVLTVQVTLWQSVSRGLQRVAGVMVGVLVAGAFARLAGIHAWSIAVVIFVALLLGRALRLGTQGSIQVPISALLVLVLGATTGGYGFDRVIDTAIGAGCGILVNLVAFPRTHLEEAAARVRGLAQGLAALVESVAGWIDRNGPGPASGKEDPAFHLLAARMLGGQVGLATRAVNRAEEACRWNPAGRRRRPEVERLQAGVLVLEMVERQVRGITRAVAEAGPHWDLPAPAAAALSTLLRQVAAELQRWEPPGAAPAEAAPADAAPTGAQDGLYEAVLGSLRGSGLTPHAAALVTAIAVDARRIREELSSRPAAATRTPGWRSLFDEGL